MDFGVRPFVRCEVQTLPVDKQREGPEQQHLQRKRHVDNVVVLARLRKLARDPFFWSHSQLLNAETHLKWNWEKHGVVNGADGTAHLNNLVLQIGNKRSLLEFGEEHRVRLFTLTHGEEVWILGI